MRLRFLSALLLATGVLAGAQRPATPSPEDKYIWLEDVSSPRAMEWVNEQNERSMKIFQEDPHWKPFVDEAFALVSNPDRLAVPALRGNEVYNTWRDAEHSRGLFRKTILSAFFI